MSPTEKERTQSTPNKENKKSHNTLVLTQWIRMWSMVSSSSRQKKHLLAKNHPILFTQSNINTFSQEACQAKKKPTFGGTHDFQIIVTWNGIVLSVSKVEYRALIENLSSFGPIQITLSSFSPHTLLPCKLGRNCSTNTPQSFKALEKWRAQHPPFNWQVGEQGLSYTIQCGILGPL